MVKSIADIPGSHFFSLDRCWAWLLRFRRSNGPGCSRQVPTFLLPQVLRRLRRQGGVHGFGDVGQQAAGS